MNWTGQPVIPGIRGAIFTALMLAAARAMAQQAAVDQAPTPEEDLKPLRTIVVSIPDRKIALVEEGRVLKVYGVAVGAKKTPTPTGTYQIANRVVRPTWYKPGKVVPPGKANPVGTRWMGITLKGYGIHGTNEPGSIGKAVSSGCIRMKNRDVEELFELVSVGDTVELHGERSEPLAQLFPAPEAPEAVQQARQEPKIESRRQEQVAALTNDTGRRESPGKTQQIAKASPVERAHVAADAALNSEQQ